MPTPIPDIPGSLFGKDVSHFQTLSDWDPDPLHFLIARASIGTQPDEMFDRHIGKAKNNDLVTGAYHFNVGSGLSVLSQVNAFIQAAGDVDLYVLDVEGKDAFTPAGARLFIRLFQEKTGKQIGLYHSTSGYPDDAFGADWRWVADWRDGITHPPIPWDIWQFGNVGGEDGNIVKSQAVLDRITGKDQDVKPAPITDETPKLTDLFAGDKLFDLDGTTQIGTASVQSLARQSPHGAGTQRAIYVTTGGVRRVALVKPRNLRPVPDLTPFSQADVKAAVDAQAAADKDELDKVQADLETALVANETAAQNERERIAALEAERIKAL